VNFAEKNDIELIVIGIFGKTGVQRFLLGSAAENVLDILNHKYSW
jgi:nucleotide-binding universal stress UspA family protein